MNMPKQKSSVTCVAVLLAAGLASATAMPRQATTSTIENTFGYLMTGGTYLEWKGTGGTIEFSEYPADGSKGTVQTVDGECLTVGRSNDFPVLELGSCDDAAVIAPGIGDTEDQMVIDDDTIAVCREDGEFTSYVSCTPAEGGQMCISDDEGYVSLRPCAEPYKAVFTVPKESEDGSTCDENAPKQADTLYFPLAIDEFADPSQGRRPGFSRLFCVKQCDMWIAVHTARFGKTYCLSDEAREKCLTYETDFDCRKQNFIAEESEQPPEVMLVLEMPKPPAGAMCLLVTSTDSKFEGKYLAAWYNRDSERTECFTTSGDQDNCEAYETGADCEDQIVFFIPDGTSPVKECVEKDQANPESWCNQVQVYLTYYESGE